MSSKRRNMETSGRWHRSWGRDIDLDDPVLDLSILNHAIGIVRVGGATVRTGFFLLPGESPEQDQTNHGSTSDDRGGDEEPSSFPQRWPYFFDEGHACMGISSLGTLELEFPADLEHVVAVETPLELLDQQDQGSLVPPHTIGGRNWFRGLRMLGIIELQGHGNIVLLHTFDRGQENQPHSIEFVE